MAVQGVYTTVYTTPFIYYHLFTEGNSKVVRGEAVQPKCHSESPEEPGGEIRFYDLIHCVGASQCLRLCLCLLVIHSGRQILPQVSHDLHTNCTYTVFRELLSTLFLNTIKIRRKPGVSIALINKSHLLPPPGLREL